jgi:hypothetical protein
MPVFGPCQPSTRPSELGVWAGVVDRPSEPADPLATIPTRTTTRLPYKRPLQKASIDSSFGGHDDSATRLAYRGENGKWHIRTKN